MSRLDTERQKELEPQRMEYAIEILSKLGYTLWHKDNTKIKFDLKGETVTFFPYSGWHTGKSIKDGRGFQNLLNQLKKIIP